MAKNVVWSFIHEGVISRHAWTIITNNISDSPFCALASNQPEDSEAGTRQELGLSIWSWLGRWFCMLDMRLSGI